MPILTSWRFIDPTDHTTLQCISECPVGSFIPHITQPTMHLLMSYRFIHPINQTAIQCIIKCPTGSFTLQMAQPYNASFTVLRFVYPSHSLCRPLDTAGLRLLPRNHRQPIRRRAGTGRSKTSVRPCI